MSDAVKKRDMIDTFVDQGYSHDLATRIVTKLDQEHKLRTLAIKDRVANEDKLDLIASLANKAHKDGIDHLMSMSMNVGDALMQFGEQVAKVMTGVIIAEAIVEYYELKPFTQEDRDNALEEMVKGLSDIMTPDTEKAG